MAASVAETLLELQDIDVEILRAQKRLEELPEKQAILQTRAKIRDTAAVREKAALLTRKVAAELKSRQDEIETHNAKLDVEQSKVMETTDHRQIQALTREMDGLKRRVDKLEMESLQYMERAEKAQSQLDTVDGLLEKLNAQEQELIARYRAAGGAVQQQIADLQATRGRLVSELPQNLVEQYQTTRDAKGGLGVGRLDGTTCTACRMSLPAERVAELENGPDVGVCPQCRRLIVVRTGAAE